MPQNNIEYSEEAQEIMGKIPKWIIRRGITVIFVIFLGILLACHFVKYPHVVTGPVIITTLNPPADLHARVTGRIDSLFVQDGEKVLPGQIIALLYSPTDYLNLNYIINELRNSGNIPAERLVYQQWLDGLYNLGELQAAYLDYKSNCLAYRYYLESRNITRKQKLIEEQLAKNTEYYKKLLIQNETIGEDLVYAQKNMTRDSLLYVRKSISLVEYENSIKSFIQKRLSKESSDATITSSELQLLQMEQQLIELSIQQENEISQYQRTIAHSQQQFISQFEQWRYSYVIMSPIDGIVNFTNYWSRNQTIQTGERMASIIPDENTPIIGRMNIPSSGMGKVGLGQKVNVKLNGYPYMEYGYLKGVVKRVSEVPDHEGYIAEIEFPEGLKSSYNRELGFVQQMDGVGEIITQDISLLGRFIQPVRAIIDK